MVLLIHGMVGKWNEERGDTPPHSRRAYAHTYSGGTQAEYDAAVRLSDDAEIRHDGLTVKSPDLPHGSEDQGPRSDDVKGANGKGIG